MSEEILKALMQLFAIISKQDTGYSDIQRQFVSSFLRNQVNTEKVEQYLLLYDTFLTDKEERKTEVSEVKEAEKRPKLTSVKDSVRTLGICKKINKTLVQKQKVVVLTRLFEMLKADHGFTVQRLGIVDTVSDVFNINEAEKKLIRHFVESDNPYAYESADLLVIDDNKLVTLDYVSGINHITAPGLNGFISIIKVQSVDIYFLRYNGGSETFLNGLPIQANNVYLLAPGSNLRLPRGTIYYSEVVSHFASRYDYAKLVFQAEALEYRFPNGKQGLVNINIEEKSGNLIGIMGASGAGKTTLLNVLSGLIKPVSGDIKINGDSVLSNPKLAKGLIGYIAQDDLLFEDLTVYQNLLYNAELCFKQYDTFQLHRIVAKTLHSLGLYEIKDIVVGNPLNKKISGGQRKRLNIALELIREPAILFVDEPTSGLSSRDSENVMDLLKELTQKGKLIFVVIHQPSSDIFKMFDKLFLLDVGGLPIYYGNPIQGVMYFKQATNQLNADVGECYTCGNVNPELLFNLIESKEVDEYGSFTDRRKFSPKNWNDLFLKKIRTSFETNLPERPKIVNNTPGLWKQLRVFIKRDVLSKFSNRQYLLLNLLEAPLLAFILAFLIRYIAKAKGGTYVYRENENIPAYIFMSIIVALFIGLTVSAEEIFKDRKILKREKFLNLSWFSYLQSKIIILTVLSAIQSILFVLIGNTIIGIKGMYFSYWLMLFSVSCCANLMGLIISSLFNTAVTIYIVIPLLIIPQMILGGAMFRFDKLNRLIGDGSKAPLVSDVMVSRWAYEGLMIQQFRYNNYYKVFYDHDRELGQLNYQTIYYIPELLQITTNCRNSISNKNTSELFDNLKLLKIEIEKQEIITDNPKFTLKNKLNMVDFSEKVADELTAYWNTLYKVYSQRFAELDKKKNAYVSSFLESSEAEVKFNRIKDEYYNPSIDEQVNNELSKQKFFINTKNGFTQHFNAAYNEPQPELLSLRPHFFSPVKYFFGVKLNTFLFNVSIIWSLNLVFFIILYSGVLTKGITFFINIKRSKQ
ncbi:MAG: ATP-binding cassette domain-containing protein [Sediminibacterium sp.]|nr:ATP-binding cassette domain-containing protein [Sediminibacterium sp.]